MAIIETSFEQRSEEWFKARLGNIGASSMSKIITSQGKPSKQREGLLFQLASEKIREAGDETYQSQAMIDGQVREDEARSLFELLKDVEIKQAAMVYKNEDKSFHISPDGLIGDDGGIEIKAPLGKTHAKYLYDNKVPTDYFVQIQSSLYVSERKYWWFMSYVESMRPLMIKVERDEKFIEALAIELNLFCAELKEIINKIQ